MKARHGRAAMRTDESKPLEHPRDVAARYVRDLGNQKYVVEVGHKDFGMICSNDPIEVIAAIIEADREGR